MKSMLLFLAAALTLAQTALADGLRLGDPGYGGTGCPAGSASATLSPDQTSLSILFDQFTVEAGGNTQKMVDRKSCNIAIPVHVPQGYSVSLFTVDYRGFNFLPYGARSALNAEYFFAGQAGPRTSRNFYGSLNSNYLFSNQLSTEQLVWSPCGASTNLRINASMMVQSNSSRQQALATVDSADIKSGLVFHIQWRRCN